MFKVIVTSLVLITSLSNVASFAQPASSEPQNFAVACVANKTNAVIAIETAWGTSMPKKRYLYPKQVLWFAYPYRNQNSHTSPNLLISFDSDLNKNEKNVLSYSLNRTAVSFRDCHNVNQFYIFDYVDSNPTFIDLTYKSRKGTDFNFDSTQ